MDLHVVATNHLVRSEVFALEMHVDRHVIFGTASTNRGDEVDCNNPALLPNQVGGVVCDEKFHTFVTPWRLVLFRYRPDDSVV